MYVDATSKSQIANIFSSLPYRSDIFVGRAKELSAMEVALNTSVHGRKGVVLYGIPGVGKTQLVLEYIARHYRQFSSILWIKSNTSETVKISFARCREQITALDGSSNYYPQIYDDRSFVTNWLRNKQNRGWLMVLDSLDDLGQDENLPRYCRDLSLGSFIVTTTLLSMVQACDLSPLHISGMEIQSAKELLLLRSFGSSMADAANRTLKGGKF